MTRQEVPNDGIGGGITRGVRNNTVKLVITAAKINIWFNKNFNLEVFIQIYYIIIIKILVICCLLWINKII